MQFWNFPSLVITVVCGHAALWTVYGKEAFTVFSPLFSESQPERGARIARAGGRLYILAGWLGFLIGLGQIAFVWSDIEANAYGPAASVCLLTISYAYLAHFLVWVPLETHFEEKVAAK